MKERISKEGRKEGKKTYEITNKNKVNPVMHP